MKHIFFIIFILISLNCLAAPSTSMSIVPIAVDSRAIKATDENARNNIVATIYNAHDHISLVSDTITIGSGTAGNVGASTYVVIVVDVSGTVTPIIRYNTTNTDWEVSDDGFTFSPISRLRNSITIGTGTAGNIDVTTSVTIIADVSGTITPTIRFNTITSVWEISNDGNTFFTISTE